jgi:hypothetical protein
MNSVAQVLAALLTIFAAGFGVSMLLMRKSKVIAAAELGATSWLLGTAVVSMMLWLFGLMVRGATLQIVTAALCLALAVIGYLVLRASKPRFDVSLPSSSAARALTLLLCLTCATLAYLCLQDPLGWDGLLVWELKARYAYLNGGALPATYFTDAARSYSHPEYPLLLPLTECWLYMWIGDADQFWVKIIFPIFFVAGAILLTRAGNEFSGRRWAGALVAVLFTLIPFMTSRVGGIVVGYADLPLSLFYLAAVYYLAVFLRSNSTTALALFVSFASVLPWLKREGAILWLVAGALGAIAIWRQRGVRSAVVSLLPGAIIIIGWQFFLHQMQTPPARDFLPMNLTTVVSNLNRVRPILTDLIDELMRTSHWSLFWLALISAFVALAMRQRNQQAALLAICVLVPIAIYCTTYLFSAWPEFRAHIATSLSRLLLQVVPVGWLAIAFALAPPSSAPPDVTD